MGTRVLDREKGKRKKKKGKNFGESARGPYCFPLFSSFVKLKEQHDISWQEK